MRRTVLLVMIALGGFGSAGCTSTEQVQTSRPNTERVRDIESESRDQPATLILRGGHTLSAERITLGVDTTRWVHPSTQNRRAVSTDCISEVRFTRHGRGMLDGLGIGAAASLGAGALTVAVPSALGRCEGLAALACGFFAIAVTVGGTIAGTVAGAVRGHRDVYAFAEETASHSTCRLQASGSTDQP